MLKLTANEKRVLELKDMGKTQKEIAAEMKLTKQRISALNKTAERKRLLPISKRAYKILSELGYIKNGDILREAMWGLDMRKVAKMDGIGEHTVREIKELMEYNKIKYVQ